MARSIRNSTKLRHWKQRFNKNAGFIWRRGMTYAGEAYKPGDPIPKALDENKTKLRRFWEAGIIELAEFDAPNVATGQVDKEPEKGPELPKGVTVTQGKGNWSIVTVNGEEQKVNGPKALDKLLRELRSAESEEWLA